MNTYDFVQMALLALGGKVTGKTKLQKTIYFLGVLTSEIDELGYSAHFYGPYSAEVEYAVNRLRSLGFVEQRQVGAGAVDRFGFELSRNDYALGDQGKAVATAKAEKNHDIYKRIVTAAQRLKKAGNLDYMKLSIAAKTYFMLDQKDGTSTLSELSDLAAKFGWSVTTQQVKEAAAFLNTLELVELG
jgi:uncharacterized protein YwgA